MINDVASIKWYKVPRFYVELKRALGKTKLRVKPKKRKWLWSAKGCSKLNGLREHTREEVFSFVDVKGIFSLCPTVTGYFRVCMQIIRCRGQSVMGVPRLLSTQHRINWNTHLCLEWISKLCSHFPSGRRRQSYTPWITWPLLLTNRKLSDPTACLYDVNPSSCGRVVSSYEWDHKMATDGHERGPCFGVHCSLLRFLLLPPPKIKITNLKK